MKDPIWLQSLAADDRKEARKVFRSRLYGLFASEDGTPIEPTGTVDTALPPTWVTKGPKGTLRNRLLRFRLRLAALYASPSGSMAELSRRVGLGDRTLASFAGPNSGKIRVGAATARAVEAACGGVVTRNQLNPEAFGEA